MSESDELMQQAAAIDARVSGADPAQIGPAVPPQPVRSATETGGHHPDPEVILALQTLVAGGAGVAANYFGSDHWNVTGDEAKSVATAIDGVLAKYLTDNYRMPVEVTLLMSLLLVFGPRYAVQRGIDAEKTESSTTQSAHIDSSDDGVREVDSLAADAANDDL